MAQMKSVKNDKFLMNKCPVCGYRDKNGFYVCPSCGYVKEKQFEYLTTFSIAAAVVLIISFFLPWIDVGINFYSNLDMVFRAEKIPGMVKDDLGFNLKLLIIVPLFAIWIGTFPIIKKFNNIGIINLQGYILSLGGFFGTFLLFFYLLKFGKYLAFGVYLQFLTFLVIWGIGLYTLYKHDRMLNVTFFDVEGQPSLTFYAGFAIALLIVLINYILIPLNVIIGLKRFPLFRR